MSKRKVMRIAITGTIGSGKTEACNYLRSKGFYVFDCDEVNRKILDDRAYELLFNDFNDCFIDNKLNKKMLANIVFNDANRKHILEDILHPLILEELLKVDEEIVFAEVPLLFEANWEKYFDLTILITCQEDIAINRLINRGLNKEDAISRIFNQMPVEEKIKKADRIIYNNGSLAQLYEAIDDCISFILC